MMMKVLTLFLTVLISATTFVAGQDPLCRNGLVGPFGLAAACCPRMCGTCGGNGCDTRPGGANNCCGTVIQSAGRSCDTNSAPCTMQRDTDCTTGLANRAEGLCCAAACGTCGGVEGWGCESRFDIPAGQSTADRCCTAGVQARNRPCANFAPPCTFATVVADDDSTDDDSTDDDSADDDSTDDDNTDDDNTDDDPAPVGGCVAANADATKMAYCLGQGYTCAQCVAYFDQRRNRRSLGEVNARHLVDTSYPECAAADYDMYLVVDGAHFAGLFTPKKDNGNNNCPSLVFHAQSFTSKGNQLEKIALHVDKDEVAGLDANNKLHVGTKPLAAIVDAFETAPVSKDGLLYDAISNNCVVMLRNMADPLDIPVDERMLSFITSKLTSAASAHIVDMMKASPALNTLYEGGRRLMGISTEDLIAKVIQLYV